MISKEAIDKFKKLYKEKNGEDLSDFVAYEAANRLINMMRAIYKPIPIEEKESYEKIVEEHAKIPESEKVDYVKHLVADAKYTEFQHKLTKGKTKKEANDILTQLTTSRHNLRIVIDFLTKVNPKNDLPSADDKNLTRKQVNKLLEEFSHVIAVKEAIPPVEAPEEVIRAVDSIRNLFEVVDTADLS